MWISGVPFGVIQVNNNVSADNNSLDIFNFQLTPNPGSGTFEIQFNRMFSEPTFIEIIDLTGRVVYSNELISYESKDKITLPKAISNGVYSCVITSGDARVSRKIAIIKD
jgi:hypothetical protein